MSFSYCQIHNPIHELGDKSQMFGELEDKKSNEDEFKVRIVVATQLNNGKQTNLKLAQQQQLKSQHARCPKPKRLQNRARARGG